MSVPKLKRSISELSERINRASPKKKRSSTTVLSSLPTSDLEIKGGSGLIHAEDRGRGLNSKLLQWYDRFAPSSVKEVALHKRKLEEVRTALEEMLSEKSQHRILLLSGPAGSSKSTCVKLLCEELVPRFRSRSKLTMTGKEIPNLLEYLTDNDSVSPTESFNEFLLQSKYRIGSNLSVLLVEDLPNLFHESTLLKFRESLLQWLFTENDVPPLVICLTECQLPESGSGNGKNSFSLDTTFISETIFGKEILSHPLLHRIKFNPINNTLMLKQLKMVLTSVRNEISFDKYQNGAAFIKRLCANTGDIRSALSALQFWCTSSSNGTDDIFIRESSTAYFHAIGKVLYGSKDNKNDRTMINDLISNTTSLNETFKLGILENLSKYNKSDFPLKAASDVVNALSETDLMTSDMEESLHYCLGKVRNIFHHVKGSSSSVHGQANFPREYKMVNEQRRFHIQLQDFMNVEFYKYDTIWPAKDSILYGSFFGPDIRKRMKFKSKSLQYYLNSLKGNTKEYNDAISEYRHVLSIDDNDLTERIGGEMKMIYASSDLGTETVGNENVRLLLTIKQKLDKLKSLKEQASMTYDTRMNYENTEFETDPISDSDNECKSIVETYDEEGDSELYEMLSQRPRKVEPSENLDLSDSDIENLGG